MINLKVSKVAIAISMILPGVACADIKAKMDDFFNQTVVSNYSSPAAIHSQEANYLSGGSAQIKTPVQNMQLARIQLPSINAGCGGINIFTGAFSFISADEFTQFAKNILQDAAPVAVRIALETWDDQIKDVLDYFQDVADFINQFNMSSCQAAELMVGAVADSMSDEKTMQHTCENLNSMNGKFADRLAAKAGCNTNDKIEKSAEEAKKTGKDETLIAPNRNLTWYVLRNHANADNITAEYIMSLVGTTIFVEMQKQTLPSLYMPGKTEVLDAFIYGGETDLYVCDGISAPADEGCLKPTSQSKKIDPKDSLITHVQKILDKVVASVGSDKNSLTPAEEQLLSTVSGTPVVASIRNDILNNRIPDTYSMAKVVSIEIMQAYMNNLMKDLKAGLASNKDMSEEIIDPIQSAISLINKDMNEKRVTAIRELKEQEEYYAALADKQALVDDRVAPAMIKG